MTTDRLFRLFKDNVIADYDFSKSPEIVRRKTVSNINLADLDLTRWKTPQEAFWRWTTQASKFPRDYVETDYRTFRHVFDKCGPLTGNVLDVGGQWGLKREWWNHQDNDIYVVHDPGVEPFLLGPHKSHLGLYERAFNLPMSFVEGLGEDLPYKDSSFDVCLIANTLDHVASPARVLNESRRCLKPGASLIITQSTKIPARNVGVSLRQIPRDVGRKVYYRLLSTDQHLNRFFLDDLIALLSQNSFSVTLLFSIDNVNSVYAIKARPE